ncbi:class I SAM-dependent methyltransferase [Streptococcus sp. 121]|uniref:tRNA (mnm(5)s(2)U34)-methyltransferase n=1 Tax=Streptococcus sp. 121 TaxID=2797637 RepID=UPI0018F0A78E|nr:class I SAM-dependent methyltransferase [Streptococcus sp. 121]MBJ6746295.1 class I SAM-dependent methyltransferase [Streptococcus sp. 121]
MPLKPLDMAHEFLVQVLSPEDTTVDATMGNGHDTLFLAQRSGLVHAFDIQEQALVQTQQRLEQAGQSNVQLHLKGHEHLAEYVDQAKAVIFNLGYLPSADKSLVTLPETTLAAVKAACDILLPGGRIAMMVYWGHPGGTEEKDALLAFVQDLPQEDYTVLEYRTLNQRNCPPFLIMIEKKVEKHG